MNYTTPGVYVEEVSVLPPSVAQVATAIPAFLGYTEKALDENGAEITGTAIRRISNLKEYVEVFGGPFLAEYTAANVNNNFVVTPSNLTASGLPQFLMYYSLKMYFDNGGGACYIVSVGRHMSGTSVSIPSNEDFTDGLEAIKKFDEPTLLVLVDAVALGADYYSLCQQVLMQCSELKDRFGIFDVLHGDDDAANFRNGIGMNQLKYGAAYMPYLKTGQVLDYNENDVSVSGIDGLLSFTTSSNGIAIIYNGENTTATVSQIVAGDQTFSITVDDTEITITSPNTTVPVSTIIDAWESVTSKGNFQIFIQGDGSDLVTLANWSLNSNINLGEIKNVYTQTYNQIKKELTKQRVILPPSSAIAGIYARVDRARGVWKSPANESINNALEPLLKIDNQEQGLLNVDPNTGKSINVIRTFTGKGIIVWGGRTLAGNDNEWRYINVRRLFIMIEESVEKATGFVVFEGNDATTWLKVKALIDSYLYGLWQQGALAGPTPDAAYFVNVGLGKTMTQQDVLEGRLIVEIGVAAVRPAEFIVLKFYHKLQEA